MRALAALVQHYILQPQLVRLDQCLIDVNAFFHRETFMQKLFLASFFVMLFGTAHEQGITRDELKRADLTGKDMDVIVTVVTVPPGKNLPKHIHPGEEAVYVLEGARLSYRTEARGNFPLERPRSILVTHLTSGSRLQATSIEDVDRAHCG